jgi:ParB family transcriptional regulator, chromosome partitioning protein
MTHRKALPVVEMIAIDQIAVLNPRARNRATFHEITGNIAQVGLKRPITVSRRGGKGSRGYDLVCGQGRLEALRELGQTQIPAVIIDATKEDCLVMSLVENCARRQHRGIELLQEIGGLRGRGYDDVEIGRKIGLSPRYVGMIAALLENGESRLVAAVGTGLLPLTVATEIADTSDEKLQQALVKAYEEKRLTGKQIGAARRIIEQRRLRGKSLPSNNGVRHGLFKKPTTSAALLRTYRREARRQNILIKKAEDTRMKLMFAVEALRALHADEIFRDLLHAEGLNTMPQYLHDELETKATP